MRPSKPGQRLRGRIGARGRGETPPRYYHVYLPMAGVSGGVSDALIRRGGEAVNGAVFSLDYADALPGPQGDRFRKNFREGMGYAPSRFEAVGYDGATLLSEAYRLEPWEEESRPAGGGGWGGV